MLEVPECALNAPFYLRHLPETLSNTIFKLFCFNGWNAWQKEKCSTHLPGQDRHENSGSARLFQKTSVDIFFQACTDPTLYIPLPLILGFPDYRLYLLVSESAFKCAWRKMAEIGTETIVQARLLFQKRKSRHCFRHTLKPKACTYTGTCDQPLHSNCRY